MEKPKNSVNLFIKFFLKTSACRKQTFQLLTKPNNIQMFDLLPWRSWSKEVPVLPITSGEVQVE